MDIQADLKHGFLENRDLKHHYQGPVRMAPSADTTAQMFYIGIDDGRFLSLGAWSGQDGWLTEEVLASRRMIWVNSQVPIPDAQIIWAGGTTPLLGQAVDSSRRMIWVNSLIPVSSDGSWSNGLLAGQFAAMVEPSRRMIWVCGLSDWYGGITWADSVVEPSRRMIWVSAMNPTTDGIAATSWVEVP
jgi:hypothetical protein